MRCAAPTGAIEPTGRAAFLTCKAELFTRIDPHQRLGPNQRTTDHPPAKEGANLENSGASSG
jgi:hypothetical protein